MFARRVTSWLCLALGWLSGCSAVPDGPTGEVGGIDESALAAPTNPNLRYFGYYYTASAAFGDYSSEVSAHANMAHVPPEQGAIQSVVSRNMKAVVDLGGVFYRPKCEKFKGSVCVRYATCGSGNHKTFERRPDGSTAWAQLRDTLRATGLQSGVLAFYHLDEFADHCISSADIDSDISRVRAEVPGPYHVVNYGGHIGGGMVIPSRADWISFQAYIDYGNSWESVRSKYDTIRSKKAASQRIVLVADAVTINGACCVADLDSRVARAKKWYDLAQQPDVVGMMPFLWPSVPRDDGKDRLELRGLRDPRMARVRAVYEDAGYRITHR